MKFTRRPDLAPQTRIDIVMLAWLHQGVYGKMTELAQCYQISRTFLYQLLFMANLQLETLFSEEKLLFQKDHCHLEQLIVLLRLEGKCSLLSIASILQALEYHPHSVGYLSQFFHSAGQTLPSTLVIPSKMLVFYLSDEIFAIHAPILVTIDARSTTILNIELASDRSADTWRAHFEALENHQFVSLGLASDRGLGLVAGYRAACDMALWVADYFHEFRDLFEVLHQVERQAYTAIDKEYDAMQKFARAKSEANLHKRLHHYDTAHHACEFLVLAWHHEHLVYHSQAKPKRAHQREREFWLACAEGLVGDEFDTLKALVFDKLDSIIRASSLVEMVNSLIRPYLNSCKGQITQATLNLIMFYHNHRRYKSGKRQGKAPIELLTGKPLEAPWWELLRRQIHTEQGVTDPGTRPSRPLLQLVTNNNGGTEQEAMASDQAILDPTGASENACRQTD